MGIWKGLLKQFVDDVCLTPKVLKFKKSSFLSFLNIKEILPSRNRCCRLWECACLDLWWLSCYGFRGVQRSKEQENRWKLQRLFWMDWPGTRSVLEQSAGSSICTEVSTMTNINQPQMGSPNHVSSPSVSLKTNKNTNDFYQIRLSFWRNKSLGFPTLKS